MMDKRLLVAALPWVFVCALGPQHARADIYTWTDGSGRVNVSNLAPPDGVQVTKVVHETPHPTPPPRSMTAADALAQADALALADRVKQLEYEVELAKRQAPPPIYYPAPPAPAPMQYAVASVQYGPDYSPPATYGCDPAWFGCGGWWSPGFYPAGIAVIGAPAFRRPFPFHGGHHFAMQRPGRPSGGFQRR